VRNDTATSNCRYETPAAFEARFSRCLRQMSFLASRVLGGNAGVQTAVENCWITASRNPPRFECEWAFRRWVLRVLITEAVGVLRENQAAREDGPTLSQCPDVQDGSAA
jgi:DNA-directed RNA polymerase specialized sigma24 family protein